MDCCSEPSRSLPTRLAPALPTGPPQMRRDGSVSQAAAFEAELAGAETKTSLKKETLRLMSSLDDASLIEVVEHFFEVRPHLSVNSVNRHCTSKTHVDQGTQCADLELLEGLAKSPQVTQTPAFESPCSSKVLAQVKLPPLDSLKGPSLPTVQFAASTIYANEENGSAIVEVIRIGISSLFGKISGDTVVHWETEDGSAKAGIKYVATKGKVVFPPSSTSETIQVDLINNADWDPTLDFFIMLKQEGLENAEVHRYHMRCRIKITDDDAFPGNRFQEKLLSDKVEEVPAVQLIRDYIMIHFKNKSMRKGIYKALATDACDNLRFIGLLVLKVWMINELLMPALEDGYDRYADHRSILLVVVAVCFHVPQFFLHFLAFQRTHWGLDGGPRKLLQVCFMRKFMNYTAKVRSSVDQGELILVLFKEIPDVVCNVYRAVFPIAKGLTLLTLLLLYQTIGTRLLGLKMGEVEPVLLNVAILLLFPVFLLVTLRLRHVTMIKSMNAVKAAELACTQNTIDMLKNYELLKDYAKRGHAVMKFDSTLARFNDVSRKQNAREVNNLFVPQALSISLSAIWIIFGGHLLSSRQISMGTFLAEWEIISQIGDCWQLICVNLLKIQEYYTELKHIVRLMNFPVENSDEKQFMNLCAAKGQQIAASLTKTDLNCIAVDQLPIRVAGLSHVFDGVVAFKEVVLDMQQGQLHLIAGRRAVGKTTLLKVIAGRSLMQMNDVDGQGYLFVPQHLRVLHISKDPLFFDGTLLDNLTYGVQEGDKDSHTDRVVNICKGMRITAHALAMISSGSDARIAHWNDVLSRSDRQILNIARGLVANPEVLCIHKPTMGLGQNTIPLVLESLKVFVALRGVEEDPNRVLFRRPRTCIFTSSTQADFEFADKVHHPFD